MKDYNIKTIKNAALLRGYFLDRQLPDEIRTALDQVCTEMDTLITEVNQIVEADLAREHRDREQKRAEREAKKQPGPQPQADGEEPTSKTIIIPPGAKDGDTFVLDWNQRTVAPVPPRDVAPAEQPPDKRKHSWSPEARAAAAARLKARREAGLLTKKEPTEPGEA